MSKQRRHFTILHKVAEHHLADRYRAEMFDGTARVPVSLRLLKQPWCTERAIIARLVDTAQALSHLRHPGIIAAGDIISLHGRPALITAPLSGASLRHVLAVSEQAGDTIPLALVISAARDVALAMEYAHDTLRMIHNDLSPGNLWLDTSGHLTLVHFEGAQSSLHRDYGDNVSFGTLSHMCPQRI